MSWRSGLVAAILTACAGAAAPALAADRPLFDFQTAIPVPGGMLRLQARCHTREETVNCRAEGLGPSGRGFRAEGEFSLLPQAPAAPEPTEPTRNLPRWF